MILDSYEKRKKYSLIFIDSTIKVFREELGFNVQRKKIDIKESIEPIFSNGFVFEFNEKFLKGQIVYSLNNSFIKNIYKKIMLDEPTIPSKNILYHCLKKVEYMILSEITKQMVGDTNNIDIYKNYLISKKKKVNNLFNKSALYAILNLDRDMVEISIAFQSKIQLT